MGGRYRVWWIPQIPGKPFVVDVETIVQGRWLEDVLANYDLFQFENNIKPDYCNVGGTQYWDEVEQEWFDLDPAEDG